MGGPDTEALIRILPVGGRKHAFDGTALIRFEDGAGAVIPALSGYIGSVIVDDTARGDASTRGVAQVNYTPSNNSYRWSDYNARRDSIEYMRALVAGLARNGVFRIDKNQAKGSADQIRHEKRA